jgi:hypothetical protein
MNKFNPSDEEMALVEILVRKVIQLNIEGLIDVNLEIDEYGLRLFVLPPDALPYLQIAWNDCEAASTEKELREMYDWLLEQEMKARETK